MTISEVTKLHDASCTVANQGVVCHAFEFTELAAFHRALLSFRERVSIHKLEQYCGQLIRQCEIFHARLARSPFSPVFCDSLQPELRKEIESVSNRSSNLESAGTAFGALRDSFYTLTAIVHNPASQLVRDLLGLSKGRSLIVVRKLSKSGDSSPGCNDSIDHAREVLGIPQDSPNIQLATASQVREGSAVDRLIFFGPLWALRQSRTEFLVRSPAAPNIQLIICSHETLGTQSQSLLQGDSFLRVTGFTSVKTQLDDLPSHSDTDWGARLDSSKATGTDEDEFFGEGQQVLALPVKYSGGKGEYLEADKRVVALRLHGCKCVDAERLLPGNLLPGDMVLRATDGSDSDVTTAFADQLLGNRAAELRHLQAAWKRALGQMIKQTGMRNTMDLLRQAGCKSLSIPNLRNWQSLRNIAPEDLEYSLEPMLRALEMEDQYPAVFKATKRLRKAHQVAGRRLHQLVLKRLRSEDLTELLVRGFLEVRDNERGPCKTAFRVEAVGGKQEVDSRRLGIIFDIGIGSQQNDE